MSRRSVLPHETRGFQQVALGVIEQDVGLRPLGDPGVRAALRKIPFEWAFARTARIDAEIHNGKFHGRAAEAQLQAVAEAFQGHPKHSQLVGLVATEGRELFNTPYLHALQRLLVLDAGTDVGQEADYLRRLQDACLGICNVVSPASNRPRTFNRDHYLALMIRSSAANSTESVMEAITRAYTIYYEMPRRPGATAVRNYCAPELWEPDVRRTISVHERFMIGMAVIGNVGVWEEQLPPPTRPTGVPPDYFARLAQELGDGDGERLARAITGDRAFYRGLFQQDQAAVGAGALNSIPFQVRPLLAQADGGYLLSSTNALASWMTRGVHYACLTPHQGTATAQAFLTYVGRLFEAYALELLESAHEAQPDVRVIGERAYDGGSSHTSDIAIVDGSDLVLIEIEAHRLTKEALLGDDDSQVLAELDTMIISKARQIDRCVAAMQRKESPASLPGVDMSHVERIWPVVVVEGGITHTALLRDHIDEQLTGALRRPGIQRLAVMSMNELEAAAGYVERGHRLAMLLHRWTFGAGRHTDFTHWCTTTPGMRNRPRAKLVDQRWRHLTAEVSSAFPKEAKAQLRA